MKLTLSLLAAAIGIAVVGSAHAVHVDRGGRGQVLIYPYYTVQNGQQTLLSVTNTSSSAQAMRVRFREGYNNREVLDFNLWLPAYDVWTATVFALADAGLPGEGAAIMTSDRSCTSPLFSSLGLTLNGNSYVSFANYGYTTTNADDGPTGHSRTREGYVEIIAMTDVSAPLLSAITHNTATGIPANCMAVQPDNIAETPAVSTRPSGGLIGAASIINVAQGTLLATRAEALAGFTNVSLFTPAANRFNVIRVSPDLASVNDVAIGGMATAHLFDDQGRALSLSYGGPGVTSRAIDAVSAVLMSDQVYNEYVISPNLNAGSDWVLTFPTKQFYVDSVFSGGSGYARPPFEQTFHAPGVSRVALSASMFDRDAFDPDSNSNSDCFSSLICEPTGIVGYAVNVLPIRPYSTADSPVLRSRLLAPSEPNPFLAVRDLVSPRANEGFITLNLSDSYFAHHRLRPSLEGSILSGLPVIGFWATNLVNNNVSNGVLSNYAAAVPHATSVSCVKASDGSACD